MKRFTLLALCILVLLSACGKSPFPPSTPSPVLASPLKSGPVVTAEPAATVEADSPTPYRHTVEVRDRTVFVDGKKVSGDEVPRDDVVAQNQYAWSPDGKWLAFIGFWKQDPKYFLHGSKIVVVRPDGAELDVIWSRENAFASHFIWSPDGKWVAIEWQEIGSGQHEVEIASNPRGRNIGIGGTGATFVRWQDETHIVIDDGGEVTIDLNN